MCAENNLDSKKSFLFMQLALLAFFLLQLPARLYPHFHPDLVDGIRGMLLGIVIATMIRMAWKKRQRSGEAPR